jgi:hypothetical protein
LTVEGGSTFNDEVSINNGLNVTNGIYVNASKKISIGENIVLDDNSYSAVGVINKYFPVTTTEKTYSITPFSSTVNYTSYTHTIKNVFTSKNTSCTITYPAQTITFYTTYKTDGGSAVHKYRFEDCEAKVYLKGNNGKTINLVSTGPTTFEWGGQASWNTQTVSKSISLSAISKTVTVEKGVTYDLVIYTRFVPTYRWSWSEWGITLSNQKTNISASGTANVKQTPETTNDIQSVVYRNGVLFGHSRNHCGGLISDTNGTYIFTTTYKNNKTQYGLKNLTDLFTSFSDLPEK